MDESNRCNVPPAMADTLMSPEEVVEYLRSFVANGLVHELQGLNEECAVESLEYIRDRLAMAVAKVDNCLRRVSGGEGESNDCAD